MNDIWREDVSRKSEQEQFRNDQSRNSKFLYMILCVLSGLRIIIGTGMKGNIWSMISIRMG